MSRFGTELQRRRLAASVSLGALARQVYYSKGHLSKVENGLKTPSLDLARACDAALGAGGSLFRLAGPSTPDRDPTPVGAALDSGAWHLDLRADGAGEMALGGHRLPLPAVTVGTEMEDVFAAVRRWGRTASPAAVLPVLVAQLHVVRAGALHTTGDARQRQIGLGARMSEFAGWMTQEAGDVAGALWWTDLAAQLAAEAGLSQMEEHVLIRRALVTLYDGRADQTVELAARAGTGAGASPRTRWLAALREAQGYALAGDQRRCLAALDRARSLAAAAASAGEPPLGPETPMDMQVIITAWCLYDLGYFAESAVLFDREVPRIPVESTRSYARFAARRVLAHASAGHVDRVCELLPDLLDQAERADSATVRAELRALARTARRWPRHAAIQRLRPRLTAELARAARPAPVGPATR
ncbi:helix-turn-helix transcriptional regulator [Micromonospora matsumotoense]|uniref:helix-turn-helix domain-containing protein n=1 Tax=Micromonospora matsumotoense TaxID=121616 RepID=UPI003401AC85